MWAAKKAQNNSLSTEVDHLAGQDARNVERNEGACLLA